MKVSELVERKIEIEFDDFEMEKLHRLEDTFDLTPAEVVKKTLDHCLHSADARIAEFKDKIGMESDD